jgi:hypothetical protein
MAQNSGFWTTDATGDGAAGGYTVAEWGSLFRALFNADSTTNGPLKGYLNELAVSGVASPVDVATGGAVVYGFWYYNDAVATVVVPTPISATRIDRIALQADWTAQTVRLARVAGVEGGAAPALTQTASTKWEVSLAQVSITTGGVITVTDERTFATVNALAQGHKAASVTASILASDAVETAKIKDLNVTAGKLAADAVETAKIKDLNVTAGKLAADAVETAKIKDLNVTAGKLVAHGIDGDKIKKSIVSLYGSSGTSYTRTEIATGSGELVSAGGTAAVTFVSIPTDRTVVFTIWINAQALSGAEGAGYIIHGAARNSGGTAALKGTPVKTILYEDDAGWNVDVGVTGSAVKIDITGDSTYQTFWSSTSLTHISII